MSDEDPQVNGESGNTQATQPEPQTPSEPTEEQILEYLKNRPEDWWNKDERVSPLVRRRVDQGISKARRQLEEAERQRQEAFQREQSDRRSAQEFLSQLDSAAPEQVKAWLMSDPTAAQRVAEARAMVAGTPNVQQAISEAFTKSYQGFINKLKTRDEYADTDLDEFAYLPPEEWLEKLLDVGLSKREESKLKAEFAKWEKETEKKVAAARAEASVGNNQNAERPSRTVAGEIKGSGSADDEEIIANIMSGRYVDPDDEARLIREGKL